MIEYLAEYFSSLLSEFSSFLDNNFDPVADTIDVLLVALGIYWLLLLIRGTRAVQVLLGLLLLFGAYLASQAFQLATLGFILDRFLQVGVIIIVVLFQADIRRALARVGRGLFPAASARQEAQLVEEVVRAAQTLAQKRVGALIVLGRETGLEDLMDAGVPVDASVSKELLISIFLPYSPLHDGAVLIEDGRITHAGCILPLSVREDLPEGVGTRHRAAIGITEETDAAVIVVSEETASISLVVGATMTRDLDAPRLRVALRDLFTKGRQEAPPASAGPDGQAQPSSATGTPSGIEARGPREVSAVAVPGSSGQTGPGNL